jgi:hypothetical protein
MAGVAPHGSAIGSLGNGELDSIPVRRQLNGLPESEIADLHHELDRTFSEITAAMSTEAFSCWAAFMAVIGSSW